jgi:hypothetical protein
MGLYNPPRQPGRAVPAQIALHGYFARPALPPDWRYVLMLRKNAAGEPLKPMAFADLGALARHLHRLRGAAGLQLTDAPLMVQGAEAALQGVSVWRLDPDTGDRRRYLGWAFVNGAGRITLEAALRAEQPGPTH